MTRLLLILFSRHRGLIKLRSRGLLFKLEVDEVAGLVAPQCRGIGMPGPGRCAGGH